MTTLECIAVGAGVNLKSRKLKGSNMDDIQILAARAALKKMSQDGYVSICTIDNILKMSGGIPNERDYQVLRTLHCVSFREMQPELLRGLPLLIQRVLESPGIEFCFEPNERMKALKFS